MTLLKIVEKKGDCTNVVSGKNIKDGPMDFMIFLSGEIKNSAMSADSVVPCLSAPTILVCLILWILQTNLSMDQRTRFICISFSKKYLIIVSLRP